MKSPKVNQIVVVYDRYRFAIPLRAIIRQLSITNDGVRVQLLESNNSNYPIGCDTVWVSKRQLRLSGEPRDVRDVQSDPQGILIRPPGNVWMLAAPKGGKDAE